MPPNPELGKVYSATYSNVPVYELYVDKVHVMRRRSDDWINATHILKVADFDKPARTRILEREVQKGVHEKVQGGYGKYQGTWIPLPDGRGLAERNGCLEKMRPIFDFVPGDRSPPPAPKHATAASSKPRTNRQLAPPQRQRMPGTNTSRRVKHEQGSLTTRSALSQISEEYGDGAGPGGPMGPPSETPDNMTIASESYIDDYNDSLHFAAPPSSRKRKRDELSIADQTHQLWADELLDYFMLLETPSDPFHRPPTPPDGIDLDRPIDDKGHTALHWAAAMGDLAVVRDLLNRGARVDSLSQSGETPLMRAVIFTNNYDKRSMETLARWLINTVPCVEWFGSTVFHHIAATTSSKSKYACARYYLDCILSKMAESYSPAQIEEVLNKRDRNGDTAITIAARNGARKCVRALIGRHAAVDIPNEVGETADELIVQLNLRRRDGRRQGLSSSPFQADSHSSLLGGGGGDRDRVPSTHGGGGLNGSTLPSALGIPTLPALTHKSASATALSTQLIPALVAKSEKLAALLDAEMSEREAEVQEAENVVAARREEIEALKKGCMALAMLDGDGGDEDGDGDGGGGGGEVERLREVVLAGLEEEQTALLLRLVREAEDADEGAGGMDTDDEAAQLALLRRILAARLERRRLVREVVERQSVAGVGERQANYKRLIMAALRVREEDVEAMLPEMLGELEELHGHGHGVEGVGVGVAAA